MMKSSILGYLLFISLMAHGAYEQDKQRVFFKKTYGYLFPTSVYLSLPEVVEPFYTSIREGNEEDALKILGQYPQLATADYTNGGIWFSKPHAIIAAATQHMPKLVQNLLEAKANPNVRDGKTIDAKTPLQIAIENDNKDVISILLKNNAYVSAANKDAVEHSLIKRITTECSLLAILY